METTMESIMKRRSVRAYQSKPLPKEIIEQIIHAGNEAPSAMNSQPWRFVVVQDAATKRKLLGASRPNALKLMESVKDADPERYTMIKKRLEELPDPVYYSAPAVVFVIGSGRYAAWSCPLACENMMLAARALGVGSCWVGFGAMVTDDEDVRKALELKEDETIFGPIILGYADAYPERPPKKEPVVKWT